MTLCFSTDSEQPFNNQLSFCRPATEIIIKYINLMKLSKACKYATASLLTNVLSDILKHQEFFAWLFWPHIYAVAYDDDDDSLVNVNSSILRSRSCCFFLLVI